jgi:hypothetical protein
MIKKTLRNFFITLALSLIFSSKILAQMDEDNIRTMYFVGPNINVFVSDGDAQRILQELVHNSQAAANGVRSNYGSSDASSRVQEVNEDMNEDDNELNQEPKDHESKENKNQQSGFSKVTSYLGRYLKGRPMLSGIISGGTVLGLCSLAYGKSQRLRNYIDKKIEDSTDILVESVGIPIYVKYDDIKEFGIRGITKKDWTVLGSLLFGSIGLNWAQKKYDLFEKSKIMIGLLRDYSTIALEQIKKHPKLTVATGSTFASLALLGKLWNLYQNDRLYDKRFSIEYFLSKLSTDQKIKLSTSSDFLSVSSQAKYDPTLLNILAFTEVLDEQQLYDFNIILEHHNKIAYHDIA